MMIPRYTSQDALGRTAGIGTLVKILGRFMRFLAPYWDKMLLMVLVNQATAFVGLLPALFSIRVIDEAFPQKNWHLGVTLILASYGTGLFNYYFLLVNSYIYNWIHMFVGYRIQFGFLRHLQKLSMSFYESRPVGEHLTRATFDPVKVEGIVVDSIPNSVAPFQTLFANLTVISTIKPALAWISLAFLLPYLVGQHLLTGWMRNVTKQQMARYQENYARYVELLNAFKTTRAMNREATERRKYWTTWARYKRAEWKMFWVNVIRTNTLDNLYWIFSMVVIPLFTIYWVIGDNMTLGEYVAAGWIVNQFLSPVTQLGNFFQGIRTDLVYAERLLDTLEIAPELEDELHARNLPSEVSGRIELENVSYAYPKGQQVLRNISLTVEPGQKVAIVGPSGAGKSTLLGLLCRFYNPTEGRVLVDGCDLRDVRRGSLMANIGVCLQDTLVLMGTIGENIWYGGRDPSREEIEEAAKLAGIHDWILSLPEGYETELQEGGQLSGGQKQRIGLARALVRDPRIMLFDEVTANLDPLLHREVLNSLRQSCDGRTVVMVSHNLADIHDSNLVFVLSGEGELVQQGTHEELLAVSGLYRRMWQLDEAERELEGTE